MVFFGFGNQKVVNIDQFDGYARLDHSSLEVKVGYMYKFPVWGSLAFMYKRRVIAEVYPNYLNYYGVQYDVNFSF